MKRNHIITLQAILADHYVALHLKNLNVHIWFTFATGTQDLLPHTWEHYSYS